MKINKHAAAVVIAGLATVGLVAIVAISEHRSSEDAAAQDDPESGPTAARAGLEAFGFDVHTPPQAPVEAVVLDGNGAEVPFSAFRGRVVLVNFWATWCGPCVREMPALAGLQKRLGGADFTIVAVSEDREAGAVVAPFLTRLGIKGLPVYYDKNMSAARAYGVSGLPTTILLDRRGRRIGRFMGAAEWDSPEVSAFLGELVDVPTDAASTAASMGGNPASPAASTAASPGASPALSAGASPGGRAGAN